ncbi:MAG: NAD-dependent dehydratase [Proteobacteria bacterium]|nr:MAG: NAD-dependent dehydratase [Pseudomonadota bacterium]
MTLSHAYPEPGRPARVVLLGAGGFLGQALAAACAAAGIEVKALGSRDVDLAEPSAATRLAGELRADDVLVFLAAITPDKGRDSAALMRNLAMARTVCEAVRAVALAQLVYASSDAVYSFATTLIAEETPAIPTDLYGAMHRTRELMLASEVKAPLAILRYCAIYGAGDTHNSYGPNRFVRQALKDGRIALFGEGEETRDHLHIADAVAATMNVIRHGSTGLVNLASGRSATFRQVAELVAEVVAARAGRPVEIAASPRQNAVTHRHFDNAALLRAFPGLGFTPLADGLSALIAASKG